MIRELNPVDQHCERVDRKLVEKSKDLNWESLKFTPVNLNEINTFENHNSSIVVNVFGCEDHVYLLRIS